VAANGGKDICEFSCFIEPPWMEKIKDFNPVTLPQIAVTTTAGTGSESTIFCAFTNTRARAKQIVILPGLAPSAAVIDPLLVRLMPQRYTAWTGFDALAHGFEAFVSRVQVPHSQGILLRLMKIVNENIREFTYNRMNHTACENMCWAASMGGVGIGLGAGAGIVHGIAHQLGALTDCHHGLANAMVTLAAERYNEAVCPDKFIEMAQAMGVNTAGMTRMQAADRWFDEIERLLADLGIKSGHLNEQLGLQHEDLEHIVNIYANDFCNQGNPRDFDFDETLRLLESMM
jgi:alcohol dehydrogenase